MLLIGGSYLIGQLTAGQDIKIIKDLGLAATSLFGLFIAVFIGIGLVSKEVERRSIYSLLAKPCTARSSSLGKYCGLVLTLAVNVAMMAVGALRRTRLHGVGQCRPTCRASWDAPALDPALLKAIALILVELMLVTAIALFFSTFSTPILSAALTFGLYIVGHFSARPAELRGRRRFAGGGAARARRSTGCCRTSRSSTSRRASCTASRCRPAIWCWRSATRLLYIAMLLVVVGVHLLAAGLQVDATATASRRPLAIVAAAAVLLAGAVAASGRARAAVSARRRRATDRCTCSRARRCGGCTGAYRALAADVYWIRAMQHYGGTRTPAGAPATRRHVTTLLYPLLDLDDVARSALQHRLPLRRGLPRGGRTRRRRPSRPGDRAPREGIARTAR